MASTDGLGTGTGTASALEHDVVMESDGMVRILAAQVAVMWPLVSAGVLCAARRALDSITHTSDSQEAPVLERYVASGHVPAHGARVLSVGCGTGACWRNAATPRRTPTPITVYHQLPDSVTRCPLHSGGLRRSHIRVAWHGPSLFHASRRQHQQSRASTCDGT